MVDACEYCKRPIQMTIVIDGVTWFRSRRNRFCNRACHASYRMERATNADPVKHCLFCGQQMRRKRNADGSLERPKRFEERRCCSKRCAQRYSAFARKRDAGKYADLVEAAQ